jgi:hypothetical protein
MQMLADARRVFPDGGPGDAYPSAPARSRRGG